MEQKVLEIEFFMRMSVALTEKFLKVKENLDNMKNFAWFAGENLNFKRGGGGGKIWGQ